MAKPREMAGIREAVAHAGSQTKLAKVLGVSNTVVSTWVRKGYVPDERVKQINEIYGIPRVRLCNPAYLELVSEDD
jgi:DNA-binding transcriptional regulator YdaS (Cro superfamily)